MAKYTGIIKTFLSCHTEVEDVSLQHVVPVLGFLMSHSKSISKLKKKVISGFKKSDKSSPSAMCHS